MNAKSSEYTVNLKKSNINICTLFNFSREEDRLYIFPYICLKYTWKNTWDRYSDFFFFFWWDVWKPGKLGKQLKQDDTLCIFHFKLMKNINWSYTQNWASLVAQTVKNLPAMQETPGWSLHWDDPLEKEMATLSSILAWRIPWTEKPGRLQSRGYQELDTTKQLSLWLSHTQN